MPLAVSECARGCGWLAVSVAGLCHCACASCLSESSVRSCPSQHMDLIRIPVGECASRRWQSRWADRQAQTRLRGAPSLPVASPPPLCVRARSGGVASASVSALSRPSNPPSTLPVHAPYPLSVCVCAVVVRRFVFLSSLAARVAAPGPLGSLALGGAFVAGFCRLRPSRYFSTVTDDHENNYETRIREMTMERGMQQQQMLPLRV